MLHSITNTLVIQPLHNLKSTNQHNDYDNGHVIITQQHKHGFVELYVSFLSRDNCFKSLLYWNFLEIRHCFDTPIIIMLMIYRRLIFHFCSLYVYYPPFVIDSFTQLLQEHNTLKIYNTN